MLLLVVQAERLDRVRGAARNARLAARLRHRTKPWEPERSPQCVEQLQAYRRAQQAGPAKLEYVLKSGQQGKDGYYGLKALRRFERGLAFETCPKGGADDPFNGTLSTCCQSY